MTISTPQPEYITETHEVVDEALEQREQTEVQFKLVPTSVDWISARTDAFMHICPVCHTPVYTIEIDQHTAWHKMLANLFQLVAG